MFRNRRRTQMLIPTQMLLATQMLDGCTGFERDSVAGSSSRNIFGKNFVGKTN